MYTLSDHVSVSDLMHTESCLFIENSSNTWGIGIVAVALCQGLSRQFDMTCVSGSTFKG